ncbi:LuxR C-terminal-related transcriptional regulator [Parasegetibacter sp. NRK P23]|uniref:LuxR C-terminal-related transcriptional regulator n=1 Tax=Parasegetibacter sp. NRK P23 TaxID=2942999 RepID=UPI0020441418|nr:LuxR C-terminal-related transcriptional regulator [Parasegetibacter sp. NRK P23]MCM5527720.1 LuxR C-terminal-related transcriptional regulator [Parasegetibacter sp. NRK P23]
MSLPGKQSELLKFDEMKKTWHQIARYKEGDPDPSFELEVHKKLLNIFHVGDYFYYIVNLGRVDIEFMSENVTKVIGVKHPSEYTVEYIYENVHPEDKGRFISHEQQVTAFFNTLPPDKVMKYKVSYDYRMRRTDGTYIWILMQTTTIQTDDSGAVIRVLGVQTDITHLKTDNTPSGLSFLGLEGEPSFYNVPVDNMMVLPSRELFTPREKEILRYLVQGFTSQEIAQKMFISKQTVDRHRKNMLAKTGLRNSLELVNFALREGRL